ncbi:MAG: FG-GAP repeat protein [Alphaproteobacteria bacterium]|nr:FG-GAP repeat protein [Alphaproteobacteria bacterium]MCB9797615.1 FG-GAP repeat protein [Alphaproteobacteria bacterium]
MPRPPLLALVALSGCILTSPKEYDALWEHALDHDGDGFVNDELPQYDGDDCNDHDDTVFPGAEELCDGKDNDCNGDVDEGRDDWQGLFRDLDADGFGDPNNPVTACPIPEDAVANAGDCDDSLPAINAAQTDLVGDDLDQNCDGVDGTDQDGDGYASVASGGEDCEDTHAEAHPGGQEVWYDGVDGDCDGMSDYDADGDGIDAEPEGQDCDDTDASVLPGGEDRWYDGVDGDCDGASDYDADRDGFDSDAYGGEDCDDDDANTSPAAPEIWYDGVDTDCGQDSDYDADADGYDSDAHGGQDCDDDDASTSPGAAERWYDGVDGDCDGGSDYDADGDGYDSDAYGGDDCDDTTSGIRPGVGETWYDGVDANCDGLSDYDADVDGHDSDTYGGDDCDDRDASTFAGADEYCDGVDSDCNGTVDDDYALNALTWYADSDGDGFGDPNAAVSSCSQPSGYDSDGTDCDDTDRTVNPNGTETGYDLGDEDCDLLVDEMGAAAEAVYGFVGGSADDAFAASIVAEGDLDADGDPDLFLGSPDISYFASHTGGVHKFSRSTLGSSVTIDLGDSSVLGDAIGSDFGMSMVSPGDCDGDGVIELVISSPYGSSNSSSGGFVYVIDFAPSSTHASGIATVMADVEIYARNNGDSFGAALSLGDVNGDGLPDLAWGAPDNQASRGLSGIMEGGGGYCTTSDYVQVLSHYYQYGPNTGDELGIAVNSVSDLTNDGIDDLVSCAPGTSSNAGACFVVDWTSLTASARDARITNYDLAAITGQSNDNLGATQHALATADVDADGQADLLIGAPGASSGDGAVYIFYGGSALAGSLSTANADITISGDGALGAAIHVGDDVDADGSADVLIGATTAGDSGEGLLYLLSGPLTASSYTLPDHQAASWAGTAAGDEFGSAIGGLIDLDGDGAEEFAVSAPGNDDHGPNKGMVYVVPGY